MQQFLTRKSIFFHWQTIALIAGFIGARLLSFITTDAQAIQAILVFLLLILFGLLYFQDPDAAWLMILTELFLGGSGHLFEFYHLSLRSLLLITFIILWLAHTLFNKEHHKRLHIPHTVFYLLLAVGGYMLVAAGVGIAHKHNIAHILQDIAPYAFFFFVLPMHHLFKHEWSKEYLIRLLIVFVIGSTIFSVWTFILFSGGFEAIHGEYYGWYRDVVMGKVTDLFTGFYRIVAPEHLLLVPTTLILASLLMRKERHHVLWHLLLVCALLTLTVNFSRTYFLALLVGYGILLYKHHALKWLSVSLSSAALVLILFSGIHYLASHGDSFGWDIFGLRVASLTQPALEESSHTRAMLLPPITQRFLSSPIFGVGLGATITFENTRVHRMITTTQFDWGYFELATELGIVGTLLYLSLIAAIIILLIQKIHNAADYHDIYIGLLAGMVSLLIMNVTTPVLLHVLGIVYITIIVSVAMKPNPVLNDMVRLLYRTFHRKSA